MSTFFVIKIAKTTNFHDIILEMGILEAFRSKTAYGLMAVGSVPFYLYLSVRIEIRLFFIRVSSFLGLMCIS